MGASTGFNGTGAIVNHGELASFSQNTTTIAVPVSNVGGTVHVEQGTLKMASTTTSALWEDSNFVIDAGTLNLEGTRRWKGNVTGSGAGTVTVTASTSAGNMDIDPAGVTFNVATENLFQIAGGTTTVPTSIIGGLATIAPNSFLTIGGAFHSLTTTMDVFGTVVRSGTGSLRVASTGLIHVHSGGMLKSTMTSGAGFVANPTTGTAGSLLNQGTIRSSGTGTSSIQISLANQGVVDATSGTLAILNVPDSILSGTYAPSAGGTVEFQGDFSIGNAVWEGAGTIAVGSGARLTIPDDRTLDGTIQVKATGTLVANGLVTLSGSTILSGRLEGSGIVTNTGAFV